MDPEKCSDCCFENTLDRVIRSTDMIREGFLYIRGLVSRLENLRNDLEDHTSKLFNGFEKVIDSISTRVHIKTISKAVTECGPLCHEVERIMDEIRNILASVEPLHKQCLECYSFIQETGVVRDSIQEWMIYINKAVRQIRHDSYHSLDLANYVPESCQDSCYGYQ